MRNPDLIAIQDKHILIRRKRGMGDVVDVAAAIRETLSKTVKESVAAYKDAYLLKAKANAMKDLAEFQAKALDNSFVVARNKYNASQFLPIYYPGGWGIIGILYVPADAFVKALSDPSTTPENMMAKLGETPGFRAYGPLAIYLKILEMKDITLPIFVAVRDNIKFLTESARELAEQTVLAKVYEKQIVEALNNAKEYFPNLPSLSEIEARLDRGENPIPELDPPKVVEPTPVPVVTPEPVAIAPMAKKSVVPWLIGAGIAAVTVFGGQK